LTGVVPGYQSRGLGYRIKLVQRDCARAEGIDRIAWAFDPLQAGNAHFNLTRLGATAGRYVENMYGERTDALNAGVPTDRLIAEWDTTAKASAGLRPDAAAILPRLIHTRTAQGEEANPEGTPLPIGVGPVSGAPQVLLEVPADIARLRRERAELAEDWRRIVRLAVGTAFDAGYRAVSVIRDDSTGERRVFYALERTSA
jgi:predicted GNAT superfamily acetyltransferase